MKFYTSYFAVMRFMPENFVPISVCIKPPVWFKGKNYLPLAPKGEMFSQWKNNQDDEEYIEKYNSSVLSNLDCANVKSDLEKIAISENPNCEAIVLVCYEKPTDFCHRHLISKWLKDNGVEIEEWERPKKEG